MVLPLLLPVYFIKSYFFFSLRSRIYLNIERKINSRDFAIDVGIGATTGILTGGLGVAATAAAGLTIAATGGMTTYFPQKGHFLMFLVQGISQIGVSGGSTVGISLIKATLTLNY